MHWKSPNNSQSSSSCPTIKNHSVTYYRDHLYCFGGYDGRRNHNSVLIYNLTEERWIRPMENHNTTAPHHHHHNYSNSMVAGAAAADHRYTIHGTPPPGRNGHSATLVCESYDNDGDPDLIISGINEENQYRTLYYTNLGNYTFLQEEFFYAQGRIQAEIDMFD